MSAKQFEAFLARLYVDAGSRARLRSNPLAEAKNAGLSNAESKALENIDWVGLEMASQSFANKRELRRPRSRFSSLTDRLLRVIYFLSDRVRRHSGRRGLE